ncbi:MAG: nucleotidyltransferase domain-containing protein [Actinomycetota bacterium]|nr:nucleotidyltransferase domain-containing protein [Actinomycetota bacterium]
MTPRSRARRDKAARLIDAAAGWAMQENAIRGLALVGSYAHGRPSMASDVDLLVLTSRPERYTEQTDWVSSLADHARIIRTARWGPVTERRLRLESGLHIDIGFADPAWAAVPLDTGTRRVLSDGYRILYDASLLLERAVSAIASTGTGTTDEVERPVEDRSTVAAARHSACMTN